MFNALKTLCSLTFSTISNLLINFDASPVKVTAFKVFK